MGKDKAEDKAMSEVSVLVAVYNAERYLPKCLDSLLRQTLRSLQIICIDDASTDGSLSVLREYAERDSRIVVMHLTENSGQAHARNVGLGVAEGRFVAYLDSDDWLAADALESAVAVFDAHPQTDCVLLRFVRHYEDGGDRLDDVYPMPPFEVLSGSEAFELSLDWTLHGCYVARGELFRSYPYDESCRAYSDDNTTRLHYLHSREVRQCGGSYFYRIYPRSVTHAVTVRRFDYLRANMSMKRQLAEMNAGERIMRKYENIRWLTLIDLCMFYHCHGKQLAAADRSHGLEELHAAWSSINREWLDRKWTLKFGYSPMPRWWMFRLEEWLYFSIRGLLGRNR